MAIKKSFNPFDFYTPQIVNAIVEAKKTDNPALYLHQSNARNIVFMLEGLTRLHKDIITDKKMEKWFERFKLLEDILGQIDHLDANIKQLDKSKVLDKTAINSLQNEVEQKLAFLNNIITEKKWLVSNLEKFEKFTANLQIQYDISFIEKVKQTYVKEIAEINEFAATINGNYTKMEDEVHEMRRKLRWLSIYAQAMQGVFQLKKPKLQPTWSRKYMKKTIINSPYNQLPKPAKNIPVIQLDYYCFIGLSFVINALGTIKDNGLQIHFIQEKFKKTPLQIKKLLGNKYMEESYLLKKASILCNPFFKEKILEKMVK